MNTVAEPSSFTARVVPLTEAVELNPRPDRGAVPDALEVTFVPMATVGAATGRIAATEVRRFGEVKKGYTVFREGDVLFAKITPCMENGKMAVARGLRNGVGCGSTEFHVLRPKPGVDPQYIYRFVSSARFRAEAAHHMTGAVGQKRVPATFLEQCEIPLPDLEEQRRIVAEIEKQFSRLDEAVANLERVTGTLNRYRDAILAAAIDGSIIGEPPSAAIPIGSTIATLDQGWSPQCESEPASRPDEWAVIKTTAIQPMAFLSAENKRLPQALVARPGLELRAGDLLVTRAGPRSRVGVACAVRSTRPRLMLCDKAYRMRLNAAVADSRYMEIVLNAPMVRDAIDELKTGISDSGVNLTQKRFRDLCVPVPSLVRQSEIVAEVDRRLSIVREVESEVDANRRRAQALRQAVLARAFAAMSEPGQ